MSLAYRLWRATRRQLLLRLGMAQGAAFQDRRGITTSPHPLEAEYRLLGAPVGAGAETLRRCWREQVRRHHPDRFAHDPPAQRLAAERLRRLNEAYRRISRGR